MPSSTTKKFSSEIRARAARRVLDHEGEHVSRRAAAAAIAAEIGCSPHTLLEWVKKTEAGAGKRGGAPMTVAARLKALERENRELLRANAELNAANEKVMSLQAALLESKQQAERANQVKSRCLAAATHDLRQPLQAIAMLLGVLGKRMTEPQARMLVGRLDQIIADMASLLDTLHDVNQIESGAVSPEISEFPLASKLTRTADEFAPLAAAKGLMLRVVASSSVIRSDRRLFGRILANLLSNAVKYTDRGKILLGCRRRGDQLRIEVWDTGVGIDESQLKALFAPSCRVNGEDASRFGFGMGLFIVERFAALLGHKIEVSSRQGEGTCVAVIVSAVGSKGAAATKSGAGKPFGAPRPTALVIEDDQNQLRSMEALLELEGYRVATARGVGGAMAAIRGPEGLRPNFIISDFHLPGGMNGIEIIQWARSELNAPTPALIVTADKSTATRAIIEAAGLMAIVKPTKASDLLAAVEAMVKSATPGWIAEPQAMTAPTARVPIAGDADIGVIDDEPAVREAFRTALEAEGYRTGVYPSAEAFFADARRHRLRCLIVDISLPGMDGIALQQKLKSDSLDLPIVFVTGARNLPMAVSAMRAGAADFLQKPVSAAALLASVARAMRGDAQSPGDREAREVLDARLGALTQRERQVLKRILDGEPNKNIAADLGISIRTVEHHRENVMRKMAAKSVAALVRAVGSRAERI